MPAHSRPIVEALQREMNVLIGLQLDDGQAPVARKREHVDHRAIGRGKGGYLRIYRLGFEALVDDADIGAYQRFQPALWVHPEEAFVARSIDVPHISQGADQFDEQWPVSIFENTLFRPRRKRLPACCEK